MANVAIIEGFTGPATPSTYKLPPGQVLEVLAVRADFNGAGSAGPYVPQVSFYAQDGRKLGSFPSPTTVAMGASAGCTFFPTAPPSSGGGGGTGIQYDTANSGDWLEIATTSNAHLPSVAFTTAGEFSVIDSSGFGSAVTLEAASGGNVNVTASGGGDVAVGGTNMPVQMSASMTVDSPLVSLNDSGVGGNEAVVISHAAKSATLQGFNPIIEDTGAGFGTSGIKIGTSTAQRAAFFGNAPVAQAAHPTTLDDVITILTNLGVCA